MRINSPKLDCLSKIFVSVLIVSVLIMLVLIVIVTASDFLTAPPGAVPIDAVSVNRLLLNEPGCFERACWQGFTPGETTLDELQETGRFSQYTPHPLNQLEGRSALILEGVGQDSDITAVVDGNTRLLSSLAFHGPYPTTLSQVIEVLGSPTYFLAGYQVLPNVGSPPVGLLRIFYLEVGYEFWFNTTTGHGENESIQICFYGNETVTDMGVHPSGVFRTLVFTSHGEDMTDNQVEQWMSYLRPWNGYGCVEPATSS